MAISNKFLTAEELLQASRICDTLNACLEILTKDASVLSVSLFEDENGVGTTFPVYDVDGEVMGHLGHGVPGIVFYLDNEEG